MTGLVLHAAGHRRRAMLVGSGRHIEDVAHALSGGLHVPVELVGFISLTPRPDNGLRSLGRFADLPSALDHTAWTRSSSPTRTSPSSTPSSWWTSATGAA